jgi:hypothetical protein
MSQLALFHVFNSRWPKQRLGPCPSRAERKAALLPLFRFNAWHLTHLSNMNKVAPALTDIPRIPKVAWSNQAGEGELLFERPPTVVALHGESSGGADATGTAALSQNLPSSAKTPADASVSPVTLTSQPLRTHELDAVPDISVAVSSERMVNWGLRPCVGKLTKQK